MSSELVCLYIYLKKNIKINKIMHSSHFIDLEAFNYIPVLLINALLAPQNGFFSSIILGSPKEPFVDQLLKEEHFNNLKNPLCYRNVLWMVKVS